MQRTTGQNRRPHAGFSLVEVLVVISIITVLISISIAVYGTMLEAAREAATMTTISKADKLLQQQITAFSREYRDSTEVKQLAAQFSDPRVAGPYLVLSQPQGGEALAYKHLYRTQFVQTKEEAWGFDRQTGTAATERDDIAVYRDWIKGNIPSESDSAELLYIALTQGRIRGSSPVDADSFNGSELSDIDEDGFNELIDGWGNPLRFYRWPTRLLNPFGFVGAELSGGISDTHMGNIALTNAVGESFSDVQADVRTVDPTANLFVVVGREIIEVQASGANLSVVKRGALSTDPENHPDGSLVKLAANADVVSLIFGSLNSSAVGHDPDDPRGDLVNNRLPAVTPEVFENSFHTLDSFHAPLIVSAGGDGVLGLFEPGDTANRGHLAAPDISVDYKIVVDPLNSTLNDNLTNLMEGVGN